MASLAELYVPFVAIMQFILAGVIVWLSARSSRAILAAVVLVSNALQGIMGLVYNLDTYYERETVALLVERATALQPIFWVDITEVLIATSIGLLALTFVRPISRRSILVGLLIAGLVPYIAALAWPGDWKQQYHMVALPTSYLFGLALVATCTVALPRVLRMEQSTARLHGLLLIAAVLIPMTHQHMWYFMAGSDGVEGLQRYDAWEQIGVGGVAFAVMLWALFRAVQVAWVRRDRAAGFLAAGMVATMLYVAILYETRTSLWRVGEHIPTLSQIMAQLLRPGLFVLAFARFEYVRFSRDALHRVILLVATVIGFSVFMTVQFISSEFPLEQSHLDVGPAFVGLVLWAVTAMAIIPRAVRALDELALEIESGGRGKRLERYKGALLAGDPNLDELRLALGVTHREDQAMQQVLAGNLVIPELAARGLRPGDELEGHRVVAHLGEGGQGVVVRAVDPAGRDVVIKQVRDAWAAGAQQRIDALRQEAEAGVGMRQVIETPFAAYLVRDYVAGRTLAQARQIDAARVHADLSAQLAALHARGWVHGDIKPSNIIITPDGGAVLIDEGAAHHTDDATQVMGSVGHMAPEQAAGATVASDVFQLGQVLQPHARGALRAWVARAMSPDPTKRPAL